MWRAVGANEREQIEALVAEHDGHLNHMRNGIVDTIIIEELQD